MKRTPLILKTGLFYPKIAGKSQPGIDLDRYITDFLTAHGIPVFGSCCAGRDAISTQLADALEAAGFTKA